MSQSSPFSLGFQTKIYGVEDYMHIDYMDRKFAAVGGQGLSIWNIKTQSTRSDMRFSLSEVPVPQDQVIALCRTTPTMTPRTVHFLPLGQSVLVSFVPSDVATAMSHL